MENLEETFDYCASNNPYYIRLTLPGFTKKQCSKKIPFDSEEYWVKIIKFIRKIRSKYKIPILIFPPMVEEVLFEEELNKPIISGVIQSSSANYAGLLPYDEICSINQIKIKNREQARKVLEFFEANSVNNLELIVSRNNAEKKFELTYENYVKHIQNFGSFKRSYFYFPFGIVLHSGFKESYMTNLEQIIIKSGKKNIILFSSKYIKPFVEKYLSADYFQNINHINLDVVVPQSNYLGGNMVMGDMMVVSDFIEFLEEYLKKNTIKPDLIIIPSSTFPKTMWHRDLRGVYYKEIERKIGIKTVLIKCDTIMF